MRLQSDPTYGNRYSIEDQGEQFALDYAWKDYKGRSAALRFTIRKPDLEDSVREFGYVPEELERAVEDYAYNDRVEMIRDLKRFTLQKMGTSPYVLYMSLEDRGPLSFNLKLSIPPTLPENEQQAAKDDFNRITSAMAEEQGKYWRKVENTKKEGKKRYLQDRGLKLEGEKIVVDYRWVTLKNRERIKDATDSLRETLNPSSRTRILSYILSFIQSLNYGTPPYSDGDKIILGFWPPPLLLVSNFGDCDSKSVAFASMWTQLWKYPLLLIKIPNHMLVGLAIPSFMDNDIVVNGVRYTFCEVTGPELMPPGLITPYSRFYLESGRFRYDLIR